MTRKEAKKLLPIIQAYAEGKTVQYFSAGGRRWVDCNDPLFSKDVKYRIKPESNYRPFNTQEECWNEMQKHEPFGWIKKINGGYKQIMAIHIDIFNKHCADLAGQTGTACFELEYIY